MDTKRTLYNFFKEYEECKDTMLFRMMPSRVKSFLNLNTVKMESLNRDLHKLAREYFEFTDTDMVSAPDEHGNMAPVVLEGKDKEEYAKRLNDLLNEPIVIHF